MVPTIVFPHARMTMLPFSFLGRPNKKHAMISQASTLICSSSLIHYVILRISEKKP